MYEMQGPCLAFGRWARRLPGWLAVTRPAAGTGLPREVPVSRFFLRSGVAPGVVPVSGSDVFLLPREGAPQGVPGGIFKIVYPSTTYPQEQPCCPPDQALFHRTIHSFVHMKASGAEVHRVGRMHAP